MARQRRRRGGDRRRRESVRHLDPWRHRGRLRPARPLGRGSVRAALADREPLATRGRGLPIDSRRGRPAAPLRSHHRDEPWAAHTAARLALGARARSARARCRAGVGRARRDGLRAAAGGAVRAHRDCAHECGKHPRTRLRIRRRLDARRPRRPWLHGGRSGSRAHARLLRARHVEQHPALAGRARDLHARRAARQRRASADRLRTLRARSRRARPAAVRDRGRARDARLRPDRRPAGRRARRDLARTRDVSRAGAGRDVALAAAPACGGSERSLRRGRRDPARARR